MDTSANSNDIIEHLDMSGKSSRKLTLSVMEINQGQLAQEVLNDLYSMFGVATGVSITDPLTNEKTKLSFLDKSEKFAESLGKLAEIRVDNPESVHKKVMWMYLPMPSRLEESFSQQYDTNLFSLEEKMLRKGVGAAGMILGRINQNITPMFNDLLNVTENYLKRNNITINQNLLATYAGSNPRTFSLIFNFIPENEEHAKRIKKGIATLKKFSRAVSTSKHISASGDNVNTQANPQQNQELSGAQAGTNTGNTSTETVTKIKAADFDGLFLNQKYIVTFQLHVDSTVEEEKYNISLLNKTLSTKSNTSTLRRNKENELKEKELDSVVSSGFFIQDVIVEYGNDGAMSLYADKMLKSIQVTLSLIERKPMYAGNFESNYKTSIYNNKSSDMS